MTLLDAAKLYSFGINHGDNFVPITSSSSLDEFISVESKHDFIDYDKITPVKIWLYVKTGNFSSITDSFSITPFQILSEDNQEVILDTGSMFYRIMKHNTTLIDEEIAEMTGNENFHSDWTFIVTWSNVKDANGAHGPFTYQAVIATDSRRKETYYIIVFGEMKNLANGLVKISVKGRVEYNTPGSRSGADFEEETIKSSNVNITGKWLFQLTESELITSYPDGPESIYLVTPKPSKDPLCPSHVDNSITIYCNVKTSIVSPPPKAVLYVTIRPSTITETVSPVESKTTDGDYNYRFTFRYKPTKSAYVLIKCVAHNAQNRYRVQQSADVIEVKFRDMPKPFLAFNGSKEMDIGSESDKLCLDGQWVAVVCGAETETEIESAEKHDKNKNNNNNKDSIQVNLACDGYNIPLSSSGAPSSVSGQITISKEIVISRCNCTISDECYGSQEIVFFINTTSCSAAGGKSKNVEELTMSDGTRHLASRMLNTISAVVVVLFVCLISEK